MSAVSVRKLWTADDLLAMGPEARYELIHGELREMSPPPGAEHGNKTEKIGARATVYAEDNGLGECFSAETGFLLAQDPDSVKAPDWAFVSRERLTVPITSKYLPLVPDIVLETRSPSDRAGGVAKKVQEWLDAGVQIVWELNLRARVLTVHRAGREPLTLSPDDVLQGEEVLPGFSLPLSRVLAS